MNIENSAVVIHNPRFVSEEKLMYEYRDKGIYYYGATFVFVCGAFLLILNDYRFEAHLLLILTGVGVYSQGVQLRRFKPNLAAIKEEIDDCAEQLLWLEPGAIYEMPRDNDGVIHHSRKALTERAAKILSMESMLDLVPEIFRKAADAKVEEERKALGEAYNRLLRNGMIDEGGYGHAFEAARDKGLWTVGVTITPLPAAEAN